MNYSQVIEIAKPNPWLLQFIESGPQGTALYRLAVGIAILSFLGSGPPVSVLLTGPSASGKSTAVTQATQLLLSDTLLHPFPSSPEGLAWALHGQRKVIALGEAYGYLTVPRFRRKSEQKLSRQMLRALSDILREKRVGRLPADFFCRVCVIAAIQDSFLHAIPPFLRQDLLIVRSSGGVFQAAPNPSVPPPSSDDVGGIEEIITAFRAALSATSEATQ